MDANGILNVAAHDKGTGWLTHSFANESVDIAHSGMALQTMCSHCAVLRCAALRCAALRCAVLCCAVLCCAVLCCQYRAMLTHPLLRHVVTKLTCAVLL